MLSMFPFVRDKYKKLSIDDKKELCSSGYRIWSGCKVWSSKSKADVLGMVKMLTKKHRFIEEDTYQIVRTLELSNPVTECPMIDLEVLRHYFEQFFTIKDRKLYLPVIAEFEPKTAEAAAGTSAKSAAGSTRPKIKAITEETWWVIRVKNDYRMCRLTFDRGEYWEMVEYVKGKIHNAQYRFPKYDNRVIYEYKEHLTPEMFESKIKEAVAIRKAALLNQANVLLQQYDTVLIARHLTGGTLVAGVEDEDDTYWYLDAYNEHGEHIFYGDNRWELEKRSRCTVLEVLRRK